MRLSPAGGEFDWIARGHEGLEDEGLGLIINRYATSQNPVLHPGLRDRTVKSWGNRGLTGTSQDGAHDERRANFGDSLVQATCDPYIL